MLSAGARGTQGKQTSLRRTIGITSLFPLFANEETILILLFFTCVALITVLFYSHQFYRKCAAFGMITTAALK